MLIGIGKMVLFLAGLATIVLTLAIARDVAKETELGGTYICLVLMMCLLAMGHLLEG